MIGTYHSIIEKRRRPRKLIESLGTAMKDGASLFWEKCTGGKPCGAEPGAFGGVLWSTMEGTRRSGPKNKAVTNLRSWTFVVVSSNKKERSFIILLIISGYNDLLDLSWKASVFSYITVSSLWPSDKAWRMGRAQRNSSWSVPRQ